MEVSRIAEYWFLIHSLLVPIQHKRLDVPCIFCARIAPAVKIWDIPVETAGIGYSGCDLAAFSVYQPVVAGLAKDIGNAIVGPYLDSDVATEGRCPFYCEG